MNEQIQANLQAVKDEAEMLWGNSDDRRIRRIVDGSTVKKTYQLRGCTYDADNCIVTAFTKSIIAFNFDGDVIEGNYSVLYPPTGVSSLFETWNEAYNFGKRRGKRVNLINKQFSDR